MNRIQFFTNEENDLMGIISFTNNVILLGSQNNPRMLYTTDYDFLEVITPHKMKTKTIVEMMKSKVKRIRQLDNVYLGDVKAGKYDGEKLRWKAEDILRGYQEIRGKQITLEEAINQKDTDFKIDMIAFLDITGRYHELSNIILRDNTKNANIQLQRKELLKEVEEKQNDGKIYKSLKRKYSYLTTFKGKEQQKERLLTIINNPVLGSLHQINEGLNTLIFLLENHKTTTKNSKFKRELQGFKQFLWFAYAGFNPVKPLLNDLNNIIKNPTLKKIEDYQNQIEQILNENTSKNI